MSGVKELIRVMAPFNDVQAQAFIGRAPGCGAVTGMGEQTSARVAVPQQ